MHPSRFRAGLLAIALAIPAAPQGVWAQSNNRVDLLPQPGQFAPTSYPALNFQWTALPPGWNLHPRSGSFQRTLMAFLGDGGQSEAFVKGYLVGLERQRTPERLARDLIADHVGLALTLSSIRQVPLTLSGVPGINVTGEARYADGTTHRFNAWFGSGGGREYGLIHLSTLDATAATQSAERVFAGFGRLNPTSSVRVADLAPLRPINSPLYKYTLRLPGGWVVVPAEHDEATSAEAWAFLAEHSMLTFIPAVLADGLKPDDVAASVLSTYGYTDPPQGVVAGRYTIYNAARLDPPAHGLPSITNKARLWIGDGVALLVLGASWHDTAGAILNEGLDHVDVAQMVGNHDPAIRGRLLTTAGLLGMDRPLRPEGNVRGLIQHAVAMGCAKRGEFKAAAELFELSLQYQLDGQAVGNWIDSLAHAGDFARAREVAVLAIRRFPRDAAVQDPIGRLTNLVNDATVSRALGDAAFSAGVVNDELFANYIDALTGSKDFARADAVMTAYKQRSNTPLVTLVEAHLRLAEDHPGDAARLLQARLASGQLQIQDVGSTLAMALSDDGQTAAAADVIEQMERAGAAPLMVAMARGRLRMCEHDYAAAKQEFERADTLAPNDPTVQQWLQMATASAGQGKNGTLRDAIAPVALPADVLPATNAPAPTLDHALGAAYRRTITTIHLDPHEPSRTTQDELIEIFDQRGVEMFNTVTLTINPLDERIFINRVEVTDLEGHPISTGNPDDYYVLDVNNDDTIATSKQTINIPVKGLRPGSLLHIVSTKQHLAPDDHVRFDEAFAAQTLPVGEAIIAVTGDTSHLAATEFNGLTRSSARADGAIIWRVNAPPYLTAEPMLARISHIAPGVALGDQRATWKDEGAAYIQRIHARLTPGNEAILREVATLNLPETATPLEKLQAVARHVQQQFAYKAIAFGPKAWMPNEPAQICANRYGDCKDQALLVHLMLRELGVQSHLALVRAEGEVYPQIASSNQFDHMINRVPAQSDGTIPDCWIDTTDRDGNAIQPTPTPALDGRHALVLDEANPRLEAMPAWDPIAGGGVSVERSLTLNAEGEFGVTDHTTFRGWMAGTARRTLRGSDQNRRNEYAARLLGLDLSDVRTWSIRFDGLDDVFAPVVIDATYVPRQKLKKTGTRFVGELPSGCERSFLSSDVVQTRRLPFEQIWGVNYEVKLDLRWPKGWRPEIPIDAAPTVLTNPFHEAHVGFDDAPSEANHRTGRLVVHSKPGVFPAERYGDYCEARQAIIDAWATPLVFRVDGSP